jgi:hypothetical protein
MSTIAKLDIYGYFLIKFTEEILLTIKSEQNKKVYEFYEEERIKKEIEAEKLKIKFLKPAEIKPLGILQYQKQQPIANPLQKLTNQPNRIKEPQKRMTIEIDKIKKETPLMKVIPVNTSNTNQNEYDIDFGRLNSIISNAQITYIDCAGPNKDITIKAGRIFKADITLNKEEIESIIKSFSEKARIPLIEGMLKARIKNLEMSAIVSLAGSSFVLKRYQEFTNQSQNKIMPKMYPPQGFYPKPIFSQKTFPKAI